MDIIDSENVNVISDSYLQINTFEIFGEFSDKIVLNTGSS